MSERDNSRYMPLPIRRALRQEANFGCAHCGCPILTIHHIIPWSQVKKHDPKNMIALCPTCAHRADMGEYNKSYLRKLKKAPHNLTVVKDAFTIQTEDIIVSLASNLYINIPNILRIDEFDIISINKEDTYPTFYVNFFDEFDNWIAIIYDNEWFVDTRDIWDIEYKPKHLIIRCKPRKISLEVEIKENIIFMRGDLYFNGFKIEMTKNDLFLGGKSGMQIRGATFRDSSGGIGISTGFPPFTRMKYR